jgi:hypothetical protein
MARPQRYSSHPTCAETCIVRDGQRLVARPPAGKVRVGSAFALTFARVRTPGGGRTYPRAIYSCHVVT